MVPLHRIGGDSGVVGHLMKNTPYDKHVELFNDTHSINVMPVEGSPLEGVARVISNPLTTKTMPSMKDLPKPDPRQFAHYVNDAIAVNAEGFPAFLTIKSTEMDGTETTRQVKFNADLPISKEDVLTTVRQYYTEINGRVNARYVMANGIMCVASLGPGKRNPVIKPGDDILVSYTPSEWFARTAPENMRTHARTQYARQYSDEDINSLEADDILVRSYIMVSIK